MIKWYLGFTTSNQRIFVDDASEFGRPIKLYAHDQGSSVASKIVSVAVKVLVDAASPSSSTNNYYYCES